MKSHTGLTESKAKETGQNSEPTVRPSNGTQNGSSEMVLCQGSHWCPKGLPRGPPVMDFYRILELTSCAPQTFEVGYRHIRKEGMTNIQLSRDSWELVRVNPQANLLIKCVYFCLGMTSAPENLRYISQTWKDLSQQLTRGESFEIASLFGSYLMAWAIYNCAEYRYLPSNPENIPLLGLPKITLSKDGAMELINYCIEQTDFMSNFPLKPFFHITKLRWEFEERRYKGNLDGSVAKTLLKRINEVVQLCHSFDQDWMKIDSFGAIVSAINLKIEIAIWFDERIRDASKFGCLKEEADGNLRILADYLERNSSVIPIYDEAWLNSVQSKFYRMIGEESQAHRYAERAAPLYLKCGRPWRALIFRRS